MDLKTSGPRLSNSRLEMDFRSWLAYSPKHVAFSTIVPARNLKINSSIDVTIWSQWVTNKRARAYRVGEGRQSKIAVTVIGTNSFQNQGRMFGKIGNFKQHSGAMIRYKGHFVSNKTFGGVGFCFMISIRTRFNIFYKERCYPSSRCKFRLNSPQPNHRNRLYLYYTSSESSSCLSFRPCGGFPFARALQRLLG